LKISNIGMRFQEVAIKAESIKIVLKPDAEVLEEVVVTGIKNGQITIYRSIQQTIR